MNIQTISLVAIVLSIIAVLASFYSVKSLSKANKWQKLLSDTGEQPENLEEIIAVISTKIEQLETKEEISTANLASLLELANRSIQKVGLIKFNSQSDDGGNLSFCMALLDNHQTGIVVTSLHGRQHNRIYSKRIVEGISETPLSEEETNAIIQAIQNN